MKVWVLLILLYTLDLSDGNKKLYLLDLYTCIEEFEEYCHLIPRFTLQSVAELANNCTNLLPGYTVYTSALDVTTSTDSEKVVVIAKTLHSFYDKLHELMSQNSTISPIILGSPYSFFNEYAATILGSKHNFAQVNFESVVTSGNELPFYNIGPTEMMLNLVRNELAIKNKWRRVGILSSIGSYSVIAEHLKVLLIRGGITVINNESLIISTEKDYGIWNADVQLTTLKKNDARIIFGFFSSTLLPLIICKGYEMGLVDEHHVWILLEMSLDDVRRASKHYNYCDAGALLKNILMVGKGYVTNASSHNYNLKQIPMTKSKLDILLAKHYEDLPIMHNVTSVKDIPGYHLSTTIFDTAWAAITALNRSIELIDNQNLSMDLLLNNKDNIPMVNPMILDVVNMILSQVKFSGLSGPVDLNNNTIKMVHVLQITTNNSICAVELFSANQTHVTPEKICPWCCRYAWGSNPPRAPSEGIFQAQLSTAWLYVTSAAIAIFMILALILIMLNILLRNNNFMKSSSLIINILIIFGCTLFIWSSILEFLTINEAKYSSAKFGSLCQVALFLHEFGHSSVHVFLLLKTWRLYRIQTNNLLKKEIKCVSDKAVHLMILILLVPMVLLFVFQSIYDPSKLTTKSETIENRYTYSKIQYSICDDKIYVNISLAAYRIILILCILWQAVNVSRMNIKKLALEGDISIRLLIVVVIVVAGLAGIRISFVHKKLFLEATIMYIMIALSFPFITITILYLPKFYMMLKEYRDKRRSKRSSEIKSFLRIPAVKNHMIDNSFTKN